MKIIVLKLILLFSLVAIFVVNTLAQEATSSECTRGKPARILNKRVFPKTTFRLKKNKSYPFEYTGFETVKLKNGDNLTIKHYGCDNYSLSFRFQTSRFSGNANRVKFWYRNAVKLIIPISKNLQNDYLIINGIKALNSYIKSNKTLKFDETIYFGGKIIESVVSLDKPKKRKGNRFEVEISFGTGPL